ncbi:MAG TPA: GH25 family lysozyme [Anaerolineales bacterium]
MPGLDVSIWQAEIDWKRVRAAGVRFALIKATEGVAYTDSTFVHNWRGAGANGILRGAYCFFHPNQDARQQAEKFVRTVREQGGEPELPSAIDLEVTDGVPAKRIIAGVKVWLDEVEQRLGRRPLIYSGVDFLDTSFTEQGKPPAWAAAYPLWLGWFPRKYAPGMAPLMPKGWSAWRFWQYSGKGRVDGIDAAVDLDLFNGTADELAAFAKAPAPVSVPTTHVVAAGETAESIANKYLISVAELLSANPQLIKAGDKLSIPGHVPAPGLPLRTHTVKQGDTLYGIAQKYGTTIATLVTRNQLTNPDVIHVGQVLVLS